MFLIKTKENVKIGTLFLTLIEIKKKKKKKKRKKKKKKKKKKKIENHVR